MLYQFKDLSKKLDEWGFPAIRTGESFQIIKGIDFEKAYKEGSISFEDDGIYLEYEGKKYRGYMFLKESFISQYDKFPKFHLMKCQPIRRFIDEGNFKDRYEWSNSNMNDLIDKTSRKIYKDKALDYCGYCKKEFHKEIKTTQDFFNSLDKSDREADKIEVDIFGYVRGKEKISKAFRKKKRYTCDSCSIQPKNLIHGRYWHTYHIDGDKTNNKLSNLQCLCILCHSYKDTVHKENFGTHRMKVELKAFVELYKEELEEVKNPYLKRFEMEG